MMQAEELLSNQFIKGYPDFPEHMTPLGQFIYYRTYSRWLPELKRRETWKETCRRATEYNMGLVPGVPREEAERFFDNMFNLRQFLSGRTLWVGGTPIVKNSVCSNFNCAAKVVDSFDAFIQIFYLLMLGTGVGIRVLKDDVEKLPRIRQDVHVIHMDYTPVAKNDRDEYTSINFSGTSEALISVGDSKTGWMQAMGWYFNLLTDNSFNSIKAIIFNYDSVRPQGERLKTFGGTASGHETLKNMFVKINNVVTTDKYAPKPIDGQLRPIHCVDIANIIGENVHCGGVRRTSEIITADCDDTEVLDAKVAITAENAHRYMSNNSIFWERKPTREELHNQFLFIRKKGEPGYINVEAARKRNPNFQNCNPCFTADMKLRTSEGDIPIGELDGKEVAVVNKDGKAVIGKVWCSGIKDVIVLRTSQDTYVKCTPDHVFMLSDGTNCQAKDLLGKRLMKYASDEAPTIMSIKDSGKEKVYDFSEPETHWGVVEGFVVHNCGEILLDDQQLCNLTTVNVMSFIKNGDLLFNELLSAQKMSARAALRMTCVELELHEWNIKQKRDRLTGCSLTGWKDAMDALGCSREQEQRLLKELRQVAREAADEYADELCINKPLLVTTCKPEGCWTIDHTRTFDQGIMFLDELAPDIDATEGFTDLAQPYSCNSNRVSKIYANEVKDILRVTLQNGRKLDITFAHPMSVNSQWVAAKDLKIGDIIDHQLGTYTNKKHSALSSVTVDEFRSDIRDYNTPECMSEDLAWLLGTYFANGCLTTNDRIKLHCQHRNVHEKAQRIWKELFGVGTSIIRSKDRDSYTQDFRSSKLRKWLSTNGLNKNKAAKIKKIPLVVRKSAKNDILAFLAGYADNDGCFYAKSFCIDSASEDLIRHFQEVGEAVGLSLSFITNSKRRGSFSAGCIYKCYMSRGFSTPEAIEVIQRNSVKAQDRPISNGLVRGKHPYKVAAIEMLEDQKTYDMEVENVHWYYQGGLKSHNTISQMANGISQGLHYSHSPYFIRRVRINADDPLCEVAERLGWPVLNEVGQGVTLDDGTEVAVTTKVIEFPSKTSAKRTQYDVSAREQLQTYYDFQKYYVDHNASNTVSVKPDEWLEVEQMVWDNWDDTIAVTFLELGTTEYELMPFEAISEAEYLDRVANMRMLDTDLLTSIENASELAGEDFDVGTDSGCAGNSCPIR